MVAIPRDKTNYHNVFKYANVLFFQGILSLETKNMSYYLKYIDIASVR